MGSALRGKIGTSFFGSGTLSCSKAKEASCSSFSSSCADSVTPHIRSKTSTTVLGSIAPAVNPGLESSAIWLVSPNGLKSRPALAFSLVSSTRPSKSGLRTGAPFGLSRFDAANAGRPTPSASRPATAIPRSRFRNTESVAFRALGCRWSRHRGADGRKLNPPAFTPAPQPPFLPAATSVPSSLISDKLIQRPFCRLCEFQCAIGRKLIEGALAQPKINGLSGNAEQARDFRGATHTLRRFSQVPPCLSSRRHAALYIVSRHVRNHTREHGALSSPSHPA